MKLGPGDLVLCSGTLAPDVGFRDRVAAAAEGGFAGISLWGRDYRRARDVEGLSDADIRALLDDHGLAVAELDGVWSWTPGADRTFSPEHDPASFFRYKEDDLYGIGDAVGARSINAVDVFGGDWGVDAAAEAFAALCDRASEHGLLVHLEFLPWSNAPDVATAWQIVAKAGRPDGGVAVDSWHFFRGTPDWEALRTVPGDRILGVQLSDGPAEPEGNLISATLRERRVPGDGDFDLAQLVATLRQLHAHAPLGVEVFSDTLHAVSPQEAARRAADGTRALLAATR
ncbi:MAG TPA: sugar phosphate isomerase/epimerase [Acidimicrobiia bacterium]|nr:sugar phosphate isomerase/epimerase [Acidimicrobiia bacterium]